MANPPERPPAKPGRPEKEGGVAVATETRKKTKRPTLYKVLFHNDDYTTKEFVVSVLMSIFHHSELEANQIMIHVHNSGIGVAGVFTYEVAETKAEKTMALAREFEYPLRVTVEKE
jgi:ATP-dependent Clp protease adaptor protein ClpS